MCEGAPAALSPGLSVCVCLFVYTCLSVYATFIVSQIAICSGRFASRKKVQGGGASLGNLVAAAVFILSSIQVARGGLKFLSCCYPNSRVLQEGRRHPCSSSSELSKEVVLVLVLGETSLHLQEINPKSSFLAQGEMHNLCPLPPPVFLQPSCV